MNLIVTVAGGAALVEKLRRLGDQIAGEALVRAATAGALLIVNSAKRKAPVRTGNLRRSIHVGGHFDAAGGSATLGDLTEVKTKSGKSFKTKKFKGSSGTDIGGIVISHDQATVLVGTNVEYARPVEYGSGRRAAKPFLRPAFDEKGQAAANEMGHALKALLKGIL